MAAAASSTERSSDPFLSGSREIIKELEMSDESFNSLYKSHEVYWMSDGSRGRCLIINNFQFKKSSFRDGSQMDVTNLKTVFEKLAFQVITKENLTSNEFTEVIEEELGNTDHDISGMFVLILMSHGGNGVIYGTDDIPVELHRIYRIIYNSKMLDNKPKFIIVKACSGDDAPKGSQNDASGSDSSDLTADVGPSQSNSASSAQPKDVLILKSAFDGFMCPRDPVIGSPFINALVEVLYDHAHDTDLETLCKLVYENIESRNDRVEKEMEMKDERDKDLQLAPLPACTSTLSSSKKLYLFPGINSDGQESFDEEDIFDFSSTENRFISFPIKPCHNKMKTMFYSDQVYRMSKVTRGRCLIINNRHFREGDREGSEVDVSNLADVFMKLNFDVIIEEDLNHQELIGEIEDEVAQPDHKNHGMFILIIMTFGDSGGVLYGSDCLAVKKQDVLKELYQSECLRGKPKLVIINACAGDLRTTFEHDMPPTSNMSALSPADVIVLRSAMDGFASIRHPELGSPFIRALVEALYKHSHHWDIERIYKQVEQKLRRAKFPQPECASTLDKKLYLFPNYDGE